MECKAWEAMIVPVDPLNPGFGYRVSVSCNGKERCRLAIHPVTGEDLDFHTALSVVQMYGPPTK